MAGEIRLKRRGLQSNWQWHMDEVLECYVTKRRNKHAALSFLKKVMNKHGTPKSIVTDKLRSYGRLHLKK